MANETTTTSANDLANQTTIEPVLIHALMERPGLARRVCRKFSLVGKPGKTLQIPRLNSYWGNTGPGERGAAVDLEFDGTEGTTANNTQVTTDPITIACGEYVAAHALTFNLEEDSAIDGSELIGIFAGVMLNILNLALDDDLIALFVSSTNGVGTSGADLTLAQALAASQGIVDRGANVDALEYVFDPEQASNIRTAVLATNAAAAVYQSAADKALGFDRVSTAARGVSGVAFMLDGSPAFSNTLCDTANSGADVVGSCYAPSTPNNDANSATSWALCEKVFPTVGLQRFEKSRTTDLVLRMRVGVAPLADGATTKIVTDAP